MLTVLNVAYPLAPVNADPIGSSEQVLAQLDAALVEAGHRSLVVACEGSETRGTLYPFPRARGMTAGLPGMIDERAQAQSWLLARRAIERALHDWPVDVVHMHGVDFANYLPPEGVPVLATLHVPPSWYGGEAFRLRRPETYLHCVSESQRRSCPEGASLLPTIKTGVRLDWYQPREQPKRKFALALGRICPEKGFHLALRAAAKARTHLLLGGDVFRYEAHLRYFQNEIQPWLGGAHRYIGPVHGERKRRLLAAARCVVVSSLVPEASSMVAMEALASGTPVIAFRTGALPEIVKHGRTGFLVDSVEEMAEAIAHAEEISPEECRRAAEERCDSRAMIERYFENYHVLAAGAGRAVRIAGREAQPLWTS